MPKIEARLHDVHSWNGVPGVAVSREIAVTVALQHLAGIAAAGFFAEGGGGGGSAGPSAARSVRCGPGSGASTISRWWRKRPTGRTFAA